MTDLKSFEMDDVTLVQDTRAGAKRGRSQDGAFILVKTDELIAFYKGLVRFAPKNIMEIGMFEGGSLVFFDKLYRPERLVGLDARRTPIEALERYRADKPHIKTYYGRFQEGPGTLMAARESFPDGIDLVVDDASHLYERTKATFLALFPLVRPGGHYVIEDWAWAHRPNSQRPGATWSGEPALTNIVFELIVLASQTKAVESVTVQEEAACICKGIGNLPRDPFKFDACLRGRELVRI